MSLYNFLMANRSKEELAKELAKLAHENAALKNQVFIHEHTIFWLTAITTVEKPNGSK